MFRALWVWSSVVLCLCASVCAAAGGGIWLDVPFVSQQKDGCGAASVAMLMHYWQHQQGHDTTPDSDSDQILKTLYSSHAHGIYASDLEKYLQQHGFRTFAFRGDWSDLKNHLEKGRPLLVALKPPGNDVPLHFVVVTGLDWQQELVLKNDPAERKLLKQDRSSFEKEWNAAANWTLLAVPQPQISSAK
jgi:ABC-type bacteriocin/lantibiotic exporter with double-glycine peptidase domain